LVGRSLVWTATVDERLRFPVSERDHGANLSLSPFRRFSDPESGPVSVEDRRGG
jgi:hypothetical protein